MKDILDKEIKKGDIVAHAQRTSTNAYLSLKLVTDTRQNHKYHYVSDEVKVIGYEYVEREWSKDTREWKDVRPYYKMSSRGGWTFPSVLVVVTNEVDPELREFLQSQLKKD